MKNHNGHMKPYIKDMGGDPKCPTNGRIDGLFFMGNTDMNNRQRLPPISPFGSQRFIIVANRFFNQTKNLYFSDFFCMTPKAHYVSLVVTTPGSDADDFCRQFLVPLDKNNNHFMYLDMHGQVNVRHADGLWVEVLYTDTVNIAEETRNGFATFSIVQTIGSGSSKLMGMPKRRGCHICDF
jgi:hypothetical protein